MPAPHPRSSSTPTAAHPPPAPPSQTYPQTPTPAPPAPDTAAHTTASPSQTPTPHPAAPPGQRLLQNRRQRRPRVLHIPIDPPAHQRLLTQITPRQIKPPLHPSAADRLNLLRHQLPQHHLLRKILRPHHHLRRPRRRTPHHAMHSQQTTRAASNTVAKHRPPGVGRIPALHRRTATPSPPPQNPHPPPAPATPPEPPQPAPARYPQTPPHERSAPPTHPPQSPPQSSPPPRKSPSPSAAPPESHSPPAAAPPSTAAATRSSPAHSPHPPAPDRRSAIPAYVFRKIGSSAYPVSARIASRAAFSPSHGTGSSNPNNARLGIVCTTFATPITGRAHRCLPRQQNPQRQPNRRRQHHRTHRQPQMLKRQPPNLRTHAPAETRSCLPSAAMYSRAT